MKKSAYCIAIALLVCCFLFSLESAANNITVSSVSLTARNKTADYVQVQFNLSWQNSWRTSNAPFNSDATWVFIKFKVGVNGEWKHASLSNTGGHSIPSGASAFQTDTKGLFIFRDVNGSGTFSLTGVQFRWNYGVDGVGDDEKIYVKVFAVEMVLVPQGDFQVGSGGQNTGEFRQANDVSSSSTATTFTITSTAPTFQGNNSASSAANLSTRAGAGNDLSTGTTTATLGAGYPSGYAAFWCMKYEITQGQYRDFLNTLTYTQQFTRTANAPNSAAGTGALISSGTYRNGIEIKTAGITNSTPAVYGCDLSNNNIFDEAADGEWVACNYLSWDDVAAYLDWAALRPMTELEYEKASRGIVTPFVNEYTWGNATLINVSSLLNTSQSTEASNTSGANLVSNNAYATGPARVGLFANGSSSRIQAGSSYYGVMEMSGNVWEQVVPISNANARSFSNVMGDGTLATNGNADVSTWPTAGDMGIRGGSYTSSGSLNYLSDRTNIISGVTTRNNNIGGRGVRKMKIVIAKVEYLIIGGGGGGGAWNANAGGGGGAGGYRCSVAGESSGGGASAETPATLTAGAYSIVVGTGGAGATGGGTANGGNGVASSAFGISAVGGGGGGGSTQGNTGGSAGGSGNTTAGSSGTANQGYAGGVGIVSGYGGGGGGGAGSVGANASGSLNPGIAGNGGSGVSSSITGTASLRGGGGGGGDYATPFGGGLATAGGGAGGNGGTGSAASAKTGGGGGGGGNTSGGGSGASGVVIIRYKTDGSDGIDATATTGGTKTTFGIYTIHTFTSSGTFVCVLSY